MTYNSNIAFIASSLIACHLIAHIICKLKPTQGAEAIKSREGHIDGLRGYLALGVYMHHFSVTYNWRNGGIWTNPRDPILTHAGQISVALFFMITGFLFIKILLNSSTQIDWKALYIRRIFRIFPLYIAIVTTLILLALLETKFSDISPKELVTGMARWLLLIGDTINNYEHTRNIIAGVDWTLKYEWLFYLSLPFLSILFRFKKVTTFLCVSILIVSGETLQVSLLLWTFNTLYFHLFLVGGIIAKLSNHKLTININHPTITITSLLSLVAIIFAFETAYGIPQSILLTIFFTPIALGNHIFGILKTNAALFLGKISYSIYLTHGIILFILFTVIFPQIPYNTTEKRFMVLMPVISPIIIIISWASFSAIEKPMMEIGKNIANFTKQKNNPI